MEEMAWFIMLAEGSLPSTVLKWGESSLDMRPCPQPRSRRLFFAGFGEALWKASTVLKILEG